MRRADPKRRQTGVLGDTLREHEGLPVMGKKVYEKSQELTPSIYKATIKGELADEEEKEPKNATLTSG